MRNLYEKNFDVKPNLLGHEYCGNNNKHLGYGVQYFCDKKEVVMETSKRSPR